MAESGQINPKIKLATKVRLLDFCKERGHSQGEVVEAALEAYFTPADADTQTLLFQKVNDLGQGMKDVITLLGSVIQHLERQAKPPPPKIATAAELYPELQRPTEVVDTEAEEEEARVVEEETPPQRSFWHALFRGRATS